jgi:hypothetical protein
MKALVAILRRVLRPLRSGIDTRYPVAANRTSQTYHHAPADLLVFFFASAVLVRLILQQAKSFLSKPGAGDRDFLRRWYGDWWCRCSTSFWYLLSVHSPWPLAGGYLLAAVLMIGAAIVEAFFGVDAEGRSLEDIADPLSAG